METQEDHMPNYNNYCPFFCEGWGECPFCLNNNEEQPSPSPTCEAASQASLDDVSSTTTAFLPDETCSASASIEDITTPDPKSRETPDKPGALPQGNAVSSCTDYLGTSIHSDVSTLAVSREREKPRWEEYEDEILRQNYGSREKLAELLPERSEKACKNRYARLVSGKLSRGIWTAYEKEIVRSKGGPKADWEGMAKHLGRTEAECRDAFEKFGKRSSKRGWKPCEIETLLSLGGPRADWEGIAKLLPGRTRSSCQQKYRSMVTGNSKSSKSTWEPAEIDMIRRRGGPGVDWEKVAEDIPGRNAQSCRRRFDELGKESSKQKALEYGRE